LIKNTALETGPQPLSSTPMDYHNYSLRLFEHFEATQAKLQNDNLLKLTMPDSTTYVLTAYKNNVEQWYDYAYTEQELDDLKHNAEHCGCSYTVEEQ
jgi:predicted nucleotidyltransferase